MSRTVIEWARGQAAPATAKHVLLVLATYADADGLCWPSVATLGVNTGLGERTVQSALRLLEVLGLLAITANKLGGRGQTPRYRLQVGKGAGAAPISPQRVQEPHPKKGLNGAAHAPIPAKRVQETTPERVHLTTLKGAGAAPELSGRSIKKEGRTPLPPKGGESAVRPEWLDAQAWEEWNRYRKGRKWTLLAANLSIAALDRFRASGDDPAAVIHQSIAAGWTGLFALKNRPAAPAAPRRETVGAYFARQRAAGAFADDDFADLDIQPPAPRRLQ